MDLFEKHIESMIFGAKENRNLQELRFSLLNINY